MLEFAYTGEVIFSDIFSSKNGSNPFELFQIQGPLSDH